MSEHRSPSEPAAGAGDHQQTPAASAPRPDTPGEWHGHAPTSRFDAGAVDVGALHAALSRDAQQVLAPREKGFAAAPHGTTAPDLVGRSVFDTLTAPFAVIDQAALNHNIEAMAAYCTQHGASLAPHVKTSMSPQLFAEQLRAGAWALTAAHMGQLAVYRDFGVRRILLANQVVDRAAIAYLAGELNRDPHFRPYVWVDSIASVDILTAELRRHQVGRHVDVIVELGFVGGRTGARGRSEALAVARRAAEGSALRVAGAAAFEGTAGSDDSEASLSAVRAVCRELRELAETIAEEFPLEVDGQPERTVVSAGGSSYFDIVTDELARPPAPGREPLHVVLRSGSYLTHDDGHLDATSPNRRGAGPKFAPALRVWTTVQSTPEPGLALACAGKRDLAYDQDLPTVQAVRGPDGLMRPLPPGIEVTGLNDQHAFIRVPAGAELSVGDWVALGMSHPCTSFDKWRALSVVDEQSRIRDVARTYF